MKEKISKVIKNKLFLIFIIFISSLNLFSLTVTIEPRDINPSSTNTTGHNDYFNVYDNFIFDVSISSSHGEIKKGDKINIIIDIGADTLANLTVNGTTNIGNCTTSSYYVISCEALNDLPAGFDDFTVSGSVSYPYLGHQQSYFDKTYKVEIIGATTVSSKEGKFDIIDRRSTSGMPRFFKYGMQGAIPGTQNYAIIKRDTNGDFLLSYAVELNHDNAYGGNTVNIRDTWDNDIKFESFDGIFEFQRNTTTENVSPWTGVAPIVTNPTSNSMNVSINVPNDKAVVFYYTLRLPVNDASTKIYSNKAVVVETNEESYANSAIYLSQAFAGRIKKTVDKTEMYVGDKLTYTFNLSFDVPIPPALFKFTDQIDSRLRVDNITVSSGLVNKSTGNSILIEGTNIIDSTPRKIIIETTLLNEGNNDLITNTGYIGTEHTNSVTTKILQKNGEVGAIKSVSDENGNNIADKGEKLTYTITLENLSSNDAKDINIKDSLLLSLPRNGITFTNPVISGSHTYKTNDLGDYVVDKVAKGEKVTLTYTITLPTDSKNYREIGKYLINVVTSNGTNPVQPTDPTNPNEVCILNKTCTITPTQSEDILAIEKSVNKSEVKSGDIVEYTITAINLSNNNIDKPIVGDKLPQFINYIDGSSIYIYYDAVGNVISQGSIDPSIYEKYLAYDFNITLTPGQKIVIKYSTRVSIGIMIGEKYTNYAIATVTNDEETNTGNQIKDDINEKIEKMKFTEEKVVSNIGEATVRVVEDKDFDNIPIIGKVFHDRDGDGYQDEAIARDVKVTLSQGNNNPVTIETLGKILTIKDSMNPIYIGTIEGITTTSKLAGEGNKVVIKRIVDSKTVGNINVTTSEGTNITLKANGSTLRLNKGKVARGNNNQNIAISRKIISNQEMTVENEVVKETKVIKNIVSPVNFDSGKSEIKGDYIDKLDEALKGLKGKENVRIVAIGYTDSQPLSEETKKKYKDNNELSEDRAQQVADYLAKELNLSPDSIEVEGRGESDPVVPNVPSYGDQTKPNRRTEIEIRYDEIVESNKPTSKITLKGYMEEITIKNLGLQEEGIPGVRLITPEGQIIETDQYGRYHIPRIENIPEKGRNVIIKVDSITLPKGIKFTTENPRTKWVTPYLINDFNFGVKYKED